MNNNEYIITDAERSRWGHWHAPTHDEALDMLLADIDECPFNYWGHENMKRSDFIVLRVEYSETLKNYVTIPGGEIAPVQ